MLPAAPAADAAIVKGSVVQRQLTRCNGEIGAKICFAAQFL
ncbi:hypothetical protein CCHOA_04730 [Corynebacterium choanae]|uniref:Uncharacterized protein n=1 Tax=Corynebacterium choanae TaxID=1862358 RepID=A0A3G6JB94_9CORY|nr:hypothetical protein CCHOA_04730 [Corynebacterium choanae]